MRVAHGYFVLSAAAGLLVDAAKGPVLLNYGLGLKSNDLISKLAEIVPIESVLRAEDLVITK